MGTFPHSSGASEDQGGSEPSSIAPWQGAARTSQHLRPAQRPWHTRWRHVVALPPLRLLARRLVVLGLLTLVILTDLIASWPVLQPSVVFAQALQHANPALAAPAWLTQAPGNKKPDLNESSPASPADAALVHDTMAWPVSMHPAKLALTTDAQTFTSSDGRLEIDVPAASLDATQLTQAKGGVQLYVSQVLPASGRTDNGGLISFGTYEFQFFDGSGAPLSTVQLLHPLTVQLLLPRDQQIVWSGQQVYTLWNPVQGSTAPPSLTTSAKGGGTTGIAPLATSQPVLTFAQASATGQRWAVQTTLSATPSTQTGAGAPANLQVAVAASTIAFNTQAPQATWGTPTFPQVGLNAGGLNYSYPLSIPPGPGGLQPALALNYASGSVNENHGWQAASPWVGQGWSLDLGSISWAQENVTPNGTATLENVWHISDPSGISGQLIPPDLTYTTGGTLNPSASALSDSSNIFIWRTAPESHAKVREIAFNNVPCWRVYLPSGVIEEFGCTDESQESYVDASNNVMPYSWKLDLMIDRFGNQVHIHYQRLHISAGYVKDAVLSSVEYDDPTCQNTTTSCSTWNPQVKILFDADQSADRVLNSGCGSGTSTSRCDDPTDSSGGLPAPKVVNAYVLNDVKVQVQGHLLHEYDFSYNQQGTGSLKDPITGQSESIAGFLTLGKIQESGTNGTSLNAPVLTLSYTEKFEHYSDLFLLSDNGVGDLCNNSYSAAPRDGSATGPCFLWNQTHNSFYLSTLDNGRGWHESISWQEAHDNAWGTDGGTNRNNAFQCSSSQTSTNVCGWADDKNWSRIVVASRTTTSNGVSSTWSYGYFLTTVANKAGVPGNSVHACNGACESYD